MRLRFNKIKFKKSMLKMLQILVPGLGTLAFILLFIELMNCISKEMTTNPFQFNNWADYAFILLWITSSIIPVVFLFFLKKKPFYLITRLGLVGTLCSIATVVPIRLQVELYSKKITSIDVMHVVSNTKLTYYILITSLIIGYIVTLVVSQKLISKSNWGLFWLALPEIICFWEINWKYSHFVRFVKMTDFNAKNIAAMINSSSGMNILLMNEIWYVLIAMTIIIAVLEMGGIICEAIYQKFKGKAIKKKETR